MIDGYLSDGNLLFNTFKFSVLNFYSCNTILCSQRQPPKGFLDISERSPPERKENNVRTFKQLHFIGCKQLFHDLLSDQYGIPVKLTAAYRKTCKRVDRIVLKNCNQAPFFCNTVKLAEEIFPISRGDVMHYIYSENHIHCIAIKRKPGCIV